MTEWKLQSYPEMLQALYQLKAATRIYRQERTAENAALMLEKFPAAAMAAAEDAAAWKRVMSGAAAGVLERAADGADVDKLAALGRNDRFYTLFAHEDAAAFQKFLAEREKNKADIAVLEGGGKADKKAKKPARGSSDAAKPAAKKEDAVVGELRREIEAAVMRDKKLTDTEKRNMLQALAETAEIKAAAKGAKCKLSFGGYAVDTVLAREGIVFEGKFSKYGGLSAETAKTLKNGKYVTTAGLAAKSTRAAENRAAKKQEESNEKLAALRQKEKAYDEALVPAFRKFCSGRMRQRYMTTYKTGAAFWLPFAANRTRPQPALSGNWRGRRKTAARSGGFSAAKGTTIVSIPAAFMKNACKIRWRSRGLPRRNRRRACSGTILRARKAVPCWT